MNLISVYRYPEAAKILYEILKDRSTDEHVNISHRKLPSWVEHLKFMKSRPYRYWYVIESNGQAVGTVYLSKRNEIGIFLLYAYRGKGFGLEAVHLLTTKHKPLGAIPGVRVGRFLANINPKNEVSKRVFAKLGFSQTHEAWAL